MAERQLRQDGTAGKAVTDHREEMEAGRPFVSSQQGRAYGTTRKQAVVGLRQPCTLQGTDC